MSEQEHEFAWLFAREADEPLPPLDASTARSFQEIDRLLFLWTRRAAPAPSASWRRHLLKLLGCEESGPGAFAVAPAAHGSLPVPNAAGALSLWTSGTFAYRPLLLADAPDSALAGALAEVVRTDEFGFVVDGEKHEVRLNGVPLKACSPASPGDVVRIDSSLFVLRNFPAGIASWWQALLHRGLKPQPWVARACAELAGLPPNTPVCWLHAPETHTHDLLLFALGYDPADTRHLRISRGSPVLQSTDEIADWARRLARAMGDESEANLRALVASAIANRVLSATRAGRLVVTLPMRDPALVEQLLAKVAKQALSSDGPGWSTGAIESRVLFLQCDPDEPARPQQSGIVIDARPDDAERGLMRAHAVAESAGRALGLDEVEEMVLRFSPRRAPIDS